MLLRIAHNAVAARLYDAGRVEKSIVQQALSYYVEGYEHTNAFKQGGWDGRSSFFEWGSSQFPAGFVPLVQQRLTNEGYNVQVIRKPLPAPMGPHNPVVDSFRDDPRYWFQMETIRRLEKNGAMIAQVATGGGKSRIARLAFARLGMPTLFLTTRSVLMYQMRDTFEQYMKRHVGVLGDGEWSPRRGFNVGMVQTLSQRLKLPESGRITKAQLHQHDVTRKLLEYFQFVILEEAHESSGDGYYTIMNTCKNANYRLALTATPFMRDDAEANMRLMGVAGPIGIRVTEKELIDSGILATPYFKYVNSPKPKHLLYSSTWPRAYKLGVVENEGRNKMIVEETIKGVRSKLPVMILVNQIAHGKIIKEMLKDAGVSKCKFIRGESDQDSRKTALKSLGSGDIHVLIGTTILDVGVDVPSVGMIILAGAGKAEVALRQRIGRGLREKKSGANIAFIVDFYDDFNSHLKRHSRARYKIVKQTDGFSERILKTGEDFDYDLLRQSRLLVNSD